jgi:hypothetical protein
VKNNLFQIYRKKHYEKLILIKLDQLLIAHNSEHNVSHKLHVIKLLSGCNLVDACRLNYPVKNILNNNKDLNTCTDEFICRAAHLADSGNLETITQAFMLKKYNIMSWLKKSISICVSVIKKPPKRMKR